jgi:two-component system sensor histidine kinase KdpD
MGLAISQAIVNAHGGGITVTSQPGHGTVFTFTVPAAEGERIGEPASQRLNGTAVSTE